MYKGAWRALNRNVVGAVTSYPVSALVFPSFREIFSES